MGFAKENGFQLSNQAKTGDLLLSATKVFKSEFQGITTNVCFIHSARNILQEIQMNDFTLEVLLLCILIAETL